MASEFEPSWLAIRFAALASATDRLPKWQALALTAILVMLVGMVDRVTGPELNLIIFYLLVTCFASWSLGAGIGTVVGIMTVILAGLLNSFHFGWPLPRQSGTTGTMVWNTLGRTLSTCIVAVLTAGLRGALDLERHRAETDMLTGVLNKSAFSRRMGATIARAQSRGNALVLGYLDLDGFKQINDAHGHAAGDGVLRAFAEAGAHAVRHSDLFARFGGDEFVVLLTVADCGQGDGAAEALHARLASILRRTGYPVTCSMGALIVPAASVVDSAELIGAADRLMYEVKHSGKNAIRIARGDLADRAAAKKVRRMRPTLSAA